MPAAANIVCQLRIRGGPDRGIITHASLQCSGGDVSATYDQSLQTGGLQSSSKGVTWDGPAGNGRTCRSAAAGKLAGAQAQLKMKLASKLLPLARIMPASSNGTRSGAGTPSLQLLDASAPRSCLLTLCSASSEITFLNTSVEGITGANASDPVHPAVLCLLGTTRAIFKGSRFTSNEATAVWAMDGAAATFTDNSTVSGSTKGCALLVSDNATLALFGSSRVANNTATPGALWGGGILATGTARVTLSGGAAVTGNHGGMLGGGILADDDATVHLHGSSITNNVAPGPDMNSKGGTSAAAAGGGGGAAAAAAAAGGGGGGATALAAALSAVLSAGMGAGGGLAALGRSSITIESSQFLGNSAGLAGGNLFTPADAVVVVGNNCFAQGQAGVHAGGIYAQGKAVLRLKNSFLSANAAASGYGGGMHASGNATMLISASHIEGNKARHGGGLVAAGNSTVNITASFIQANRASADAPRPEEVILDSGHSGGVAIGESARVVISDGSVIEGNYAGTTGGGVIVAGYSSVLITRDVTIASNSVSFSGAGLYFSDQVSATISDGVHIVGNTVGMGSTCGTGGGFAAWNMSLVLVTGRVVIANNSAPVRGSGGGFAVGGFANVTVADESELSNNLAGSTGGAAFLGGDGKLGVMGGVTFVSNKANTGGAVAAIGDTLFIGNIAGSSGTDVQAEAGCSISMAPSYLRNGTAVVWFRKQCLLGEFLESGYCQPCPPLTYGLDPSFTRCMQCPSNANCAGVADITPLPDFWHSSKQATQIHSCPRKGVCLDGGFCAEGYTGHVCGSCVQGYGLRGAWVCAECGSLGRTLAVFIASAVILFVLASILVHTTLKDNRAGLAARPRPSDFLKILLRHVQNVAIISTVSVTWPDTLSPVFKAVGWVLTVGGRELVSFDCLFQADKDAPATIPVAVRGVLLNLFAPLVILAAVLLARLLVAACCTAFLRYCVPSGPSRLRVVRILQQRRQQLLLLQLRQQSQRRQSQQQLSPPFSQVLYVSFLVVLFFFYPSLVHVSLGMFACLRLDAVGLASDPYPQYAAAASKFGYWLSNMKQPCWEGWHKAWAFGLGLPCALLFCFGVPAAVWLLLFCNKKRLQGPGPFRDHFGFLYHHYKGSRYLWEVAAILQIAVAVTISVLSHSLGVYFTALLLQLGYAGYFVMQYALRPYTFKLLNTVALLSSGCLFASTSLLLTLLQVDAAAAAPAGYVMAAGVLTVVLNVAFVLLCLFLAGKHSQGILARLGTAAAAAIARLSWVQRRIVAAKGAQTTGVGGAQGATGVGAGAGTAATVAAGTGTAATVAAGAGTAATAAAGRGTAATAAA